MILLNQLYAGQDRRALMKRLIPSIGLARLFTLRPGGPRLQLAKQPRPRGNLLKTSMEGTKEEAYFTLKEGVECLKLVSSSSERSLSISDEKLGRPAGLAGEAEWEEVIRVYLRLRRGLIRE